MKLRLKIGRALSSFVTQKSDFQKQTSSLASCTSKIPYPHVLSQRIAQLLSRKTLALQVTGSNRLNMDCMGGQSSALKLLLSTFGV